MMIIQLYILSEFSESVPFEAVLMILKLNLSIGIAEISSVGFLGSNVLDISHFFQYDPKSDK